MLIYGLSVENVGMLTLYTMRKIVKGTQHTSGLISVKDRYKRTLKLEELFSWFYVRIAAKIPRETFGSFHIFHAAISFLTR